MYSVNDRFILRTVLVADPFISVQGWCWGPWPAPRSFKIGQPRAQLPRPLQTLQTSVGFGPGLCLPVRFPPLCTAADKGPSEHLPNCPSFSSSVLVIISSISFTCLLARVGFSPKTYGGRTFSSCALPLDVRSAPIG